MNPSTSLGTRSKVGMAKPSPPIRQAGNIWHLLVRRGVCRRSLRSACAHVTYRCRCRVKPLRTPSPLSRYLHEKRDASARPTRGERHTLQPTTHAEPWIGTRLPQQPPLGTFGECREALGHI